jgi:hypothetical protein
MITGNLPKSFFGETGKSSETRKTEIKKKTPNVASKASFHPITST